MRIVVNHLTRMKPGFVCVAGLNLETQMHVRPELTGQLRTNVLARNGGPFDIAAIVDLGTATPAGRTPEVEDHRVEEPALRKVTTMDADAFWGLLLRVSAPELRSVFGEDLDRCGSTLATPQGRGAASLGCLRTSSRPPVRIFDSKKVKMRVSDGRFSVWLPVTDARLFEVDQVTPRSEIIEELDRRIQADDDIILSVGLTRPWPKPGTDTPMHWLQVNNVHLRDCSTWGDADR